MWEWTQLCTIVAENYIFFQDSRMLISSDSIVYTKWLVIRGWVRSYFLMLSLIDHTNDFNINKISIVVWELPCRCCFFFILFLLNSDRHIFNDAALSDMMIEHRKERKEIEITGEYTDTNIMSRWKHVTKNNIQKNNFRYQLVVTMQEESFSIPLCWSFYRDYDHNHSIEYV